VRQKLGVWNDRKSEEDVRYEIKREVTLIVEADNKKDAVKTAKDWGGETWSGSFHGGEISWNSKSKFVSAKKLI
jgi:hypothetical protein